MKKTIITTVLAALSVSTAMAASIANFTNATEQQNPYAQSNAQVQSQAVALEQVNYGKVNGKVVNPVLVKLRRTLLSENFHTPMGSSHCWLYAAV